MITISIKIIVIMIFAIIEQPFNKQEIPALCVHEHDCLFMESPVLSVQYYL